mgnify:CR=1 FL=1
MDKAERKRQRALLRTPEQQAAHDRRKAEKRRASTASAATPSAITPIAGAKAAPMAAGVIAAPTATPAITPDRVAQRALLNQQIQELRQLAAELNVDPQPMIQAATRREPKGVRYNKAYRAAYVAARRQGLSAAVAARVRQAAAGGLQGFALVLKYERVVTHTTPSFAQRSTGVSHSNGLYSVSSRYGTPINGATDQAGRCPGKSRWRYTPESW